MAPGVFLFMHLFLTVAGAVVGKVARDAMFLGSFTPLQMTCVELATMGAVAIVVWIQLRLQAHLPIRRLLILAPLCLAAGDAALWVGLRMFSADWLVWIVYVWVGVQATIAAPHASVLTAQVLSIRQARQTCGRVGAGAIAGWIGGGLLAKVVATQLGASSLLIASGLLTVLCSVIVATVWPAGEDAAGMPLQRTRPGSLGTSSSLVWRTPHLRSMAALAFISAAVTTIAGLQFKAIASHSTSGVDHLAALFGSFNLYAGLVALAAQLVVTPRVIDRFGLGPALAIAPAALAAGSAGVFWSGTFAAALLMKGSDQVLRYSVDRAAIELLYRPLPERELFEGKTFIDAIVSRCGDAAGAMLALFAGAVLQLSFPSLGALTIPLILAWMLSARIAHRAYGARLLDDLRCENAFSHCAERPAFARRSSSGTCATAATRRVLDPDPATRLRFLRALTGERPRQPCTRRSDKVFSTALGAEIIGFAVLVDGLSSPGGSWSHRRDEGSDAIERISRLLCLLTPDRYPGCLVSALRSGDPSVEARAEAYLDMTLTSPHRQVLMPLLDRWALAAASNPAATAPRALFGGRLTSVIGVLTLLTSRLPKGAAS